MSEKSKAAARGLPSAQKVNLVSAVSYQEGSVVSRTLVDDRAGTVTLFAFDEGQGLSEHTSPFSALLHVLDGEALVTIAGDESRVAAGEAILLPAGKPHAIRAPRRFKMLLTMVRSTR
jgi:quercetin dioxygenase-like cupin family protein